MRTLSTTVNSRWFFIAWFLCFMAPTGPLNAEECSQGKGLTSNFVWKIAGSGDTLWMATDIGINMIAGKGALADPTKENNWWSYTLRCKKGSLNDLTFDGGFTIASYDTAPNVIWTLNHATMQPRETTFPWPVDPPVDSLPDSLQIRRFFAADAVRAAGNCYLACLDGGLVKSDLGKNHTVFIPGDTANVNLSDSTLRNKVDSTRHVIQVEMLYEDSVLLITTPKRLWLFSIADSSWDSVSITEKFADNNIRFLHFSSIYVNNLDAAHPIYGIIKVQRNDTGSIFCKYNRAAGVWDLMLDVTPKALSFAPNGYCYMLFNDYRPGTPLRNVVKLYRDTLGDSGVISNPRPDVSGDRIPNRMTETSTIDLPEEFFDVLYIPRSDSSGYLWIATSEGLFFSRNENPGKTDTAFTLIKRAPAIASGLKKTYARPGIITPAVKTCKFIYNVAKVSTRVTIKVYDYNMDLVKTIVENSVRQPGNQGGPLGRSTVESEDSWDGRNAQGRPVAPGIYYYKITTDKGERSFGKIVVAR